MLGSAGLAPARRGHCIALPGCGWLAHRDDLAWLFGHAKPEDSQSEGWCGTLTPGHVKALSSAVPSSESALQAVDPQRGRGLSVDQCTSLTVRASAPTQHA